MRNFFGIFKRRQWKRNPLAEAAATLRSGDYVPSVTMDDVLRIVRRDFPPSQADAVLAVLQGYGSEKWHQERIRVYLAILKLSHGDIAEVRRQLEVAKTDYRDVLAPAESSGFWGIGFVGADQMTKEEVIQLMNADREQYNSWLARSDKGTND